MTELESIVGNIIVAHAFPQNTNAVVSPEWWYSAAEEILETIKGATNVGSCMVVQKSVLQVALMALCGCANQCTMHPNMRKDVMIAIDGLRDSLKIS